MDVETIAEDAGVAQWPLRPWLLAGLLGIAGLLIHLVTDDKADVPWRAAVGAFVFFGALAAAFAVERERWQQPTGFALVVGLVMAGLAWRAVHGGDHLADPQYGFASGVVATALALPLFQAGVLRARLRTPYAEIYRHIWTDAIAGAGALAFTGLSWLALAILSQLFQLLDIDVLRDLMQHGWFAWTFSGLAFGAALGVLRNEARVLEMLRSVVLLVLSLLAVPLAAGLVLFLLATAVSGPQVLWEATRRATPVLLTCAAGAFVLTCVIVRQDDAAMTRSRVLRWAALALAAIILPLAAFAAVSLGLRLQQHGLSPERLWGLVTVIVACLWGVGYWSALLVGRRGGWPSKVREANFLLALGTCGLALFLALPILDFGAISARNQVARLESGRVTPDTFDFSALRWDFGDAGRRALKRLAKNGHAAVAERAQIALRQTQHPYDQGSAIRTAADIPVTVRPDDPELRGLVTDFLAADGWRCRERCAALEIDKAPDGRRRVALVEGTTYEVFLLGGGKPATPAPTTALAMPRLTPDSRVEIRPLPKRYIFVDGKPVGPPLD